VRSRSDTGILRRCASGGRVGRSLLRDRHDDPLGKQVTDLMSKALTESGAYLVFERPDIGRVQAESRLTDSKLKLIGVDALIVGSLTEFGRKTVGATGFAGRRFFKEFVKRTALVDGLDDALELAIAGEQGRIGGIGLHFARHFRIDRQLFAAAHEPRRSILQRQLDPTPGPRCDDVAFAYGVADFQAADDTLRAAGKDFSLEGGYAGNDEGFGHDVRSDRISGWRNNSRPLPGCLLY